ncbi:hypothetical protein ACFL0Q_02000 [Thermodesulfobacteriota bacterium]
MDTLSLKSIFRMLLLGVALIGFLGACSSASRRVKAARQTVKEAYELQKPLEVRTSKEDKRPEWTKKTMFEGESTVHFAGGFLSGSDYSVSVRCANAEALKVAVQSISQFVRAEFSEYAHGTNTDGGGVERHVDDGLATFVDNLHLQGLMQKKVYYEETFSPAAMQTTFNIWVQLEMSQADFLKAKADAVRRLRDRLAEAGQVEAKEKADKLLDDLKRGVEGEASSEI